MYSIKHSELGRGFLFDWNDILELQRAYESGALPDDPEDIRNKFLAAVRNAEALRVLFGGNWDAASRASVESLFEVIRADHAWSQQTNSTGSKVLQ